MRQNAFYWALFSLVYAIAINFVTPWANGEPKFAPNKNLNVVHFPIMDGFESGNIVGLKVTTDHKIYALVRYERAWIPDFSSKTEIFTSVLYRLNGDGSTDLSFGNKGQLSMPGVFATGKIFIEPAGNILIETSIIDLSHHQMIRILPSGRRDERYKTSLFGPDEVHVVDRVGRLIRVRNRVEDGYRTIHLEAFLQSGKMDEAYGILGKKDFTLGPIDVATSSDTLASALNDGQVIVACLNNDPVEKNESRRQSLQRIKILKFTSFGTIEARFGGEGTGVVDIDLSENVDRLTGLHVDDTGRIRVIGNSLKKLLLGELMMPFIVGVDANGRLDQSFAQTELEPSILWLNSKRMFQSRLWVNAMDQRDGSIYFADYGPNSTRFSSVSGDGVYRHSNQGTGMMHAPAKVKSAMIDNGKLLFINESLDRDNQQVLELHLIKL